MGPVSDRFDNEPQAAIAVLERVIVRARDLESEILAAYDEHEARLKAFALAAVRDGTTADDLVQESFLRLITEMRDGPAPDNVGAWLFRVCANLIASRGRRLSVARRWLPRLVDRDTGRTPEDVIVRREGEDAVIAALGRLAPDARLALLLAAQGLDSAEIGAAIRKSPGATRTMICRSRARLRSLIAGVEEGAL